jgi:hypothetical protein
LSPGRNKSASALLYKLETVLNCCELKGLVEKEEKKTSIRRRRRRRRRRKRRRRRRKCFARFSHDAPVVVHALQGDQKLKN